MVVLLAACLAVALGFQTAAAREIHVATTGSDSSPGGKDRPYRTIGQAASVAQPGDTVIMHAGTYREWVKPARGGTGEDQRITYRAASGEVVIIKGSERVTSWTDEGGGVWKAELPNDLFGDYNPYALNLSGGWLEYGKWHHRGTWTARRCSKRKRRRRWLNETALGMGRRASGPRSFVPTSARPNPTTP